MRKFAKYWRDSASLLILARDGNRVATRNEYNYKVSECNSIDSNENDRKSNPYHSVNLIHYCRYWYSSEPRRLPSCPIVSCFPVERSISKMKIPSGMKCSRGWEFRVNCWKIWPKLPVQDRSFLRMIVQKCWIGGFRKCPSDECVCLILKDFQEHLTSTSGTQGSIRRAGSAFGA